jgi:hypothetical protein
VGEFRRNGGAVEQPAEVQTVPEGDYEKVGQHETAEAAAAEPVEPEASKVRDTEEEIPTEASHAATEVES